MNFPSLKSDRVLILLLSLQRISRNLSRIINELDVNVNSLRRLLLTKFTSSMPDSSSSSIIQEQEDMNNDDLDKNEDFYEKLFDQSLEPPAIRITSI